MEKSYDVVICMNWQNAQIKKSRVPFKSNQLTFGKLEAKARKNCSHQFIKFQVKLRPEIISNNDELQNVLSLIPFEKEGVKKIFEILVIKGEQSSKKVQQKNEGKEGGKAEERFPEEKQERDRKEPQKYSKMNQNGAKKEEERRQPPANQYQSVASDTSRSEVNLNSQPSFNVSSGQNSILNNRPTETNKKSKEQIFYEETPMSLQASSSDHIHQGILNNKQGSFQSKGICCDYCRNKITSFPVYKCHCCQKIFCPPCQQRVHRSKIEKISSQEDFKMISSGAQSFEKSGLYDQVESSLKLSMMPNQERRRNEGQNRAIRSYESNAMQPPDPSNWKEYIRKYNNKGKDIPTVQTRENGKESYQSVLSQSELSEKEKPQFLPETDSKVEKKPTATLTKAKKDLKNRRMRKKYPDRNEQFYSRFMEGQFEDKDWAELERYFKFNPQQSQK